MDWKSLLKQGVLALVGLLIPVLYSALIGKFPDFPLTVDNLMALAVWFVSLMFAGAKTKTLMTSYKAYKFLKK